MGVGFTRGPRRTRGVSLMHLRVFLYLENRRSRKCMGFRENDVPCAMLILGRKSVRAEPHGNRHPLDFQLISAFESLGMLVLPKQSSLC